MFEEISNKERECPSKPETDEYKRRPIQPFRTIISLLVYMVVYLLIFRDFKSVLALVLVILIHETGHFVAMKLFRYEDVSMFFVPFVGAYVSGRHQQIDPIRKSIMILAGPVPGILIGTGILLFVGQSNEWFLSRLAFLFIFLNWFNLLPVSPMDGGQLVETLYPGINHRVQFIFLSFSILLLCYMSWVSGNYLILILVAFLLFRLATMTRLHRIRRLIQRQHLPLQLRFEDLTDCQYWDIRELLRMEIPQLRGLSSMQRDPSEMLAIGWIHKLLIRPSPQAEDQPKQWLLTLVWLIILLVPIMIILFFSFPNLASGLTANPA